MVSATILKFEGTEGFRQKLLLATLSNKSIKITNIRSNPDIDSHPGLKDYEISFLRLLEKMTNGCTISISHTGTSLVYKPGVIIGGEVQHDCPTSRGIGYFLEPMIAMAPFCKFPLSLTLSGITNNNLDMSVDSLRTCLLPQLKKYGLESGLELRIVKRGALPYGGGEVYFSCPVLKELKPVLFTEEGKIKRIRGLAYATRISPQMANRVVESARGFLTRYIPDVYIYTDVYRGQESGKSPGYALTLVAESTTGALLCAECAFEPKPTAEMTGKVEQLSEAEREQQQDLLKRYNFPTPEDLGMKTARMLLCEIKMGGCVDSNFQWLAALNAALGPEDIGKFKIGELTPFTIQYLRDIKTFLGVTFNIDPNDDDQTILMTCLGSGFSNANKKLS